MCLGTSWIHTQSHNNQKSRREPHENSMNLIENDLFLNGFHFLLHQGHSARADHRQTVVKPIKTRHTCQTYQTRHTCQTYQTEHVSNLSTQSHMLLSNPHTRAQIRMMYTRVPTPHGARVQHHTCISTYLVKSTSLTKRPKNARSPNFSNPIGTSSGQCFSSSTTQLRAYIIT